MKAQMAVFGVVLIVAAFLTAQSLAAQPQPDRRELAAERSWLKKHLLNPRLERSPEKPAPLKAPLLQPGLDVLANNDGVFPNRRGDKPMKLGDREYVRGLHCHAVSKIEVHLPAPGTTFSAVVGLDHNDDTARGKGSVIFSVTVNDKVAFRSGVMRYGTPAQDVDVDLHEAKMFTLEIGDADDGIGWDQSDWADARVTLVDGRTLWLGDMPLRDHRGDVAPPPMKRSSELSISFAYGGQSSDHLLASWPKTARSVKLDAARLQHSLTWTDPRTGLEVRCLAVEYKDFPVAEWTIFFKNTGKENTPILENIQALDARFDRGGAKEEFLLLGNKGDWCAPQSYEPYRLTLPASSQNRFAPDGGRPTNGPRGWPSFHLH